MTDTTASKKKVSARDERLTEAVYLTGMAQSHLIENESGTINVPSVYAVLRLAVSRINGESTATV